MSLGCSRLLQPGVPSCIQLRDMIFDPFRDRFDVHPIVRPIVRPIVCPILRPILHPSLRSMLHPILHPIFRPIGCFLCFETQS